MNTKNQYKTFSTFSQSQGSHLSFEGSLIIKITVSTKQTKTNPIIRFQTNYYTSYNVNEKKYLPKSE